jgi:hypothetical protein
MPMIGPQVALTLHNDISPAGTPNDVYAVQIWDWKSGTQLRTITTEAWDGAVYDADAETLTGFSSASGNLTRWDLATSQPAVKVTGPNALQNSHSSTISSKMVAYSRAQEGSDQDETILWDINPDSIVAKICREHRNLSVQEWDTYVGSDYPYHSTCT